MLNTQKGRRVILDVSSLPTTGESRYLYHNTTDGHFYAWNTVTNSFDDLSASSPDASGSILASNACVGTLINIPNGNISDVKTIGTGGDFTDLQTALANVAVTDETILRLISNLTISVTINVAKKVVIDGNGFNLESATSGPVTMLNVTAGATIKNFGKISHFKTTNTSIESVIAINSPDPVYIYNNTIELQEFGIVARGSFFIGKNTFKYIGASATNSHRFIGLYGNSGESRIYENNFECSVIPATTRYSNFIYATSTTGTVYNGKLFINDNVQISGSLRQFFLHDSGVPNNMELYVANNVFNDFNGGIGIFGVAVYNGYKKIGIYSNRQGADAVGNYKGVFFVDGTGAINENVIVEYAGNIQATTILRPDYTSYDAGGSTEIAISTNITFVDKKEKVKIEESLENLGQVIQDLKGRKTYLVGVSGIGTEEDPYIIQSSYSMSDLSDIVLGSLANGQVLMYNSLLGVWENKNETKSNYTESNVNSASFIQNKPTITTGVGVPIGSATIGSIYLENDLLGNSVGSFVYNGTAWVSLAFNQVQADWTQADSSNASFIKNKPTLANVATSGDYNSLLNKPTIPDAQIQSDYAQTNTFAVDYIKNKPDLSVYELVANKGVPSGYAPLNSSGKIDASFLSISGTEYKGTWNPTTNTPTLVDGIGTNGWFYYVDADFSRDLGSGTIDFQEGNIVIYDNVSNQWKKVGGQQLITNDLDVSLTDFTDNAVYYYGGNTDAGDWQVNKWVVATNVKSIAKLTNNAGVTSLPTAWTNRLTLNYL